MQHSLRRLAVVATAVASTVALTASAALAKGERGAAARQAAFNAHARTTGGAPTPNHTPDDGDLADRQGQYSFERTAPGTDLAAGALVAASQQAAGLPSTGGAWQEVTTQPYNANPSDYTDPFWSNAGSGFSIVGGRTTALARSGDGSLYAGTADGGVWKSSDNGQTWSPTSDNLPSLSIGALAINPADGTLWVATGEANTNQDSYAGTGVYRSTDGGRSYQRVGDDAQGNNPLFGRTVYQLTFAAGTLYAATDNGLWRLPAGTSSWNEVLAPAAAGDPTPYYTNQVTAVTAVPGTNGKRVIAAVGWRSAKGSQTQTNGFYESRDSGATFAKVAPGGQIDGSDIGRTTFAYSADGSKLYAIVQSPAMLNAGAESVLQGIFVTSGKPADPAGSWTKIADESTLAGSGSALAVGSGYGVGVQAWYNQALAVDPANPNHVYASLEEVFQTTDGGKSWNTASPYWNYGLACGSSCPDVTHPDQHAVLIDAADRSVLIGNDGGVYSRSLTNTAQYGGWSDLNASLRSWQYYDARAGRLGGQGIGVVGGLQDNGTSVLDSGSPQMVEPAGGDGFDVVVDPSNANNMVGEYTDGAMYTSTDGGHTFQDYVSPTCVGQEIVGTTPRADCDPNARFVTPLAQDAQNKNVWVTGGRYVWITQDGWNTSCTESACSWHSVFDTGAANAVTAVSSANGGQIAYAAWVTGGGNPSASFNRGIATNDGGTWHQVSTAGLPNRYIAGVTVDPANPAHAYAVFNGYSRRWIPGGGVGHVFETRDGGASWTDVSGNLPDIASDALVIAHGRLALATDAGAYTAAVGQGTNTQWSRLGTGLPNASVNDVTVGPDGNLYAATHGRGVWRLGF